MPRASMQQREAKEKGERSSRLRPGRVRRANTPPPRVTGTAKNLFRLVRLVSRSSPGSGKAASVMSAGCPPLQRSSPFQRRAIVNVRYSSARTPGGWKAHGTYIERESAKGDRLPTEKETDAAIGSQVPDPDRLGLAQEHPLGRWLKAGSRPETSASSKSSFLQKTQTWTSSERRQTWWPGSSSTPERRSNGEAWSTATPTIHTRTSLCGAVCHPGSRSNFHRP